MSMDNYFGAKTKICKRKAGGVGLLVNEKISKFVRIINSNNENCLWFELSNELCSTKTYLVLFTSYPLRAQFIAL